MITHTEATGGLLTLIIIASVSTGWILAAIHYRPDDGADWEPGQLEEMPSVEAHEPTVMYDRASDSFLPYEPPSLVARLLLDPPAEPGPPPEQLTWMLDESERHDPHAVDGWQVTDTGSFTPPYWLAARDDLVTAIPALGKDWV